MSVNVVVKADLTSMEVITRLDGNGKLGGVAGHQSTWMSPVQRCPEGNDVEGDGGDLDGILSQAQQVDVESKVNI